MDLRTIQVLMGHNALGTTQRYLHLVQPNDLSATSRLNLLNGLAA